MFFTRSLCTSCLFKYLTRNKSVSIRAVGICSHSVLHRNGMKMEFTVCTDIIIINKKHMIQLQLAGSLVVR